MTTTSPSPFFKFTVADLRLMGVLSSKDIVRLEKKHVRLNAKRRKELRQSEVNDVVEVHLESLTAGDLFKHRTIWESIGREEFTRDEVLTALQTHKENFLVEQVRKGPNNFQVFWTVSQSDETEVENGE